MSRPNRRSSVRTSSRPTAGGRRRRARKPGVWALVGVIVLAAAVVGTISLFSNAGHKGTGGPSAVVSGRIDLKGNTFYEGVFVDGIPLGGLTREQAKAKVEAAQKEFAGKTGVTVVKDSQRVLYRIADLPYTFDTDAVLDEAWAQGRSGADAERLAFIRALPGKPVKLATKVNVDATSLEEKIREMAEPYTVAPVDAAFVGYDATKPDGQRLTFSPDVPGSRVDADALWAAVKKEFDDNSFGAVEMQATPVDAKIKLADLQGNMQLIGECDTYLSNHKTERYTNIRLASEAISGKVLAPQEVFSFNDTTGERTANKGYMDAPIDNQGVQDVGIGGGVCQVSGTLFNAAMRAGLVMVERHHHSIPSAYLKKGKDATVDYGKYDLKLQNGYDKPIVIIMHYGTGDGKDKYTLYAEIYGPPMPEGVKGYDLAAQITKTLPAKDGFRTVSSKIFVTGQQQVIDAHDGYEVKVYIKTIMKDGTEKTADKPLYTDTYDPDCKVIVYYYQDAKPTGLPTATPSPTPEATPAPTQKPEPTPSPAPEETPA